LSVILGVIYRSEHAVASQPVYPVEDCQDVMWRFGSQGVLMPLTVFRPELSGRVGATNNLVRLEDITRLSSSYVVLESITIKGRPITAMYVAKTAVTITASSVDTLGLVQLVD